MARALQAEGISCTVFEKALGVGGLWRENYSGYGVQAPAQLFEFPDFPHRGKRSPCDAFTDLMGQHYMPGAEVQAYIEAYAEHFALAPCVVLDTEVTGLTRCADGQPGWSFARSGSPSSATPSHSYHHMG